MKIFAISFIKFYQHTLSPYLKTFSGGGCRFTPTCSEYACCAIEKHGFKKGFFLSLKRILKCNPGSPAGFDPVG